METRISTSPETESCRSIDIRNASKNAWLVKVPQFLADEFKNAPESSEIGRIRITKSSSRPQMKFSLSGSILESAALPKDYEMKVSDIQEKLVVFGEEMSASGNNDGKIVLVGNVNKKASIQPEKTDKSFLDLKRERAQKEGSTRAQVKTTKLIIDKPVQDHNQASLSKKIECEPFSKYENTYSKVKRNKENRAPTRKGKLQSARSDLYELDKQRGEELEKEAACRESLKNMMEDERKETEKHHQELVEKHKEHPKIHHPGSKPQLEQVWEEQDHMPREEFNHQIFSAMHDVNSDGHFDVEEVDAVHIPEGLDEQSVYSNAELEEYMWQSQMEMHQYGHQWQYYDVGIAQNINYQIPPGGVPPEPGYSQQQMPGGHPQQFHTGQPQQQFQAVPPQLYQGVPQQQFQGVPPQQYQQAGQQQQAKLAEVQQGGQQQVLPQVPNEKQMKDGSNSIN